MAVSAINPAFRLKQPFETRCSRKQQTTPLMGLIPALIVFSPLHHRLLHNTPLNVREWTHR